MKYFSKLLLAPLIVLASCQGESTQSTTEEDPEYQLFEKVAETHTGISFQNNLTENFENGHNILDFDFFFNGAGVGIGDFDNDGLEDIIFTANQGVNKIYQNKGGLKFEDKTEGSGIDEGKHWSNGVAISDINGDGLLDIYISPVSYTHLTLPTTPYV